MVDEAVITAWASPAALLIVFTTTLVLVPRSSGAARLGAVLAMAGLTYLFCDALRLVVPWRTVQVDVVMLSWVALLSGAEEVLVSRVDAIQLSHGGRKMPGEGQLAYRALCLFFNLRRIGTRWEIQGVRRGPGRERGRWRFVLAMMARCVVAYLVADAMQLMPLPEQRLVAVAKQTPWRLWELTGEDAVFRLGSTVGLWVVTALFQTFNISVAGFVTVLLGLSKPEGWPPLFGPLRSMSSIRGFWGTFWHQCLRKALTGWADFVSDDVLRLQRGTVLSRYTRLSLAFLLSGVLHECQDRLYGLPKGALSSVTFFSLQALGIMVEDCARAATAAVPVPKPVRRAAGYVWVIFFLCLTTPLWSFPKMRLGDEGDLVPYSVAKRLFGLGPLRATA